MSEPFDFSGFEKDFGKKYGLPDLKPRFAVGDLVYMRMVVTFTDGSKNVVGTQEVWSKCIVKQIRPSPFTTVYVLEQVIGGSTKNALEDELVNESEMALLRATMPEDGL